MAISRRTGIIGAVSAAVVTAAAIGYSLMSSVRVLDVRDYGDNLQAAIDAANTGDTIQLNGIIAICNCRDYKGVTIVGPGVIKTPNADPAIYYPPGTPPAALRSLEVTTSSGQVYDIIRYGTWGPTQDTFDEQPQGLTIDSCNVHGQGGQEVQRGVAANGRNFVLTNSKVMEIHGKGYDTQAICAWNGSGPFTIINNDLQASGENILFGGADASIPNLVPDGIEIRRNRIVKPLEWRGVWSAKNLLEVKNGRNVVIDGNVLTNSWGDAQIGFGALFTVRNQDGTNPWAVVENISFTNNQMTNVAGGFQLIGKDWPNISQQSSKLRIANNVISLAADGTMGPNGRLLQVQQFNAVTFENNESEPPHSFANLTGTATDGTPLTFTGFTYRNNLVGYGQYGLFSEGDQPYTTFAPDGVVSGNYIYGLSIPLSKKLVGNVYADSKPASMQIGVGVDYAALNAAINGTAPSPSPSASASTSLPSPTASATASATPTAVPTATPTPTPVPLPSPTPTPTLPFCASGARPGNPPTCRCRDGVKGNSGKCR